MPALPILAGVAAVATVASVSAQNKAAKAQRRQNTYVRQMDTLKSARERVQAIRQARLASGTALQASVNQGASDTSASIGGLGSIISQLNSNLSFLDTSNRLSDQAGIQAGKAIKYGAQAATWGAVADIGSTVFSAAGGTGAFKKK